MKVTTCELHDKRSAFARDWERLIDHVRHERSELVVLPEMPFCRWFAGARTFDIAVWQSATAAHDAWEHRLRELASAMAPVMVIASRPVDFGNERYNEGFVWSAADGTRGIHAKSVLCDEAGAWETQWYHRATPEFTPAVIGVVSVGFLFATELQALEEATMYGREGVQLLVTPRSTATADRWLATARDAAARAGAYGLSANRIDDSGAFDGQGWIIAPDGEVLAVTDREQPFVSAEVDIERVHEMQVALGNAGMTGPGARYF